MNWVLQLKNNSQSVNSFNSLVEKFNMQSSPNQPNPNPNQSVIDRGNLRTQKMCLLLKVKRPVPTRSMKKVCTKNLVLQIDRGNLINCLKTSVLSKLTMEQGNLLSKAALVHTQWKNNLFLKKIVTLRHSTRTTSSTVQSTRRTLTSTFQDYHILQWNDHMASTFKIWFRRSRTTLSDMHFKVIFNNIDNSILSAKNHETWSKQLETLNCVNHSMLSQKHTAKHAWRIGTLASSAARTGTSSEMIRKKTRKYLKFTLDLFSIPNCYIKKGRPHGHRYGKKEGDHEYFIANQLKKKCKKREFLSIRDRFNRDARFRKTMIELVRTEEVIREMDKLANKDHTHHAAEEEISVYRNNWWIRSNFVGSDTMPVRHRADFKEALSPLRRLKNQEDTAHQQRWQSYSSSWWNWQDSWWHPSSEYHRDDGPSTDRSGKPAKRLLGQLFVEWFSKFFWFRITVIFGNSQQQFTVTDGVCKEYTSKYRKFYAIWLRRKRQQQHERWD